MKTILIELTQEEAEYVQSFTLKEQNLMEADDGTRDEVLIYKIDRCKSILNKLESAQKPQKDEPITHKDLSHIISVAKSQYVQLPLNMHISKKRVEETERVTISLAQSLILWFNGRNMLKRAASFDVTDNSIEFEDGND